MIQRSISLHSITAVNWLMRVHEPFVMSSNTKQTQLLIPASGGYSGRDDHLRGSTPQCLPPHASHRLPPPSQWPRLPHTATTWADRWTEWAGHSGRELGLWPHAEECHPRVDAAASHAWPSRLPRCRVAVDSWNVWRRLLERDWGWFCNGKWINGCQTCVALRCIPDIPQNVFLKFWLQTWGKK